MQEQQSPIVPSTAISELAAKPAPRRSKLRNKILSYMVGAASVPFLISGAIVLYMQYSSNEKNISTIEQRAITGLSDQIHNFLSENLSLIELILDFKDREEPIENIVVALASSTITDVNDTVTSTQDGTKIKYIVQPYVIDNLLRGILEASSSAFDNVYFIDVPSGREISQRWREGSDSSEESFPDYSKLAAYQVASRGQEYVSSDANTMRGPIVTVAQPVRNKVKKVIGVVMGQLNLSAVQKYFDTSGFGRSGYVYVANSFRDVLFHTDRVKATATNMPDDAHAAEFWNNVSSSVAAEGNYASFWGERVAGSGKRLSEGNARWYIVAEWPRSDADSNFWNAMGTSATLYVLLLLMTVFVSILLSNKIVKPITMLQEGTKRVSLGMFEEPVKVQTHDEIEELGTSFNDMMTGLKRLQELRDEFVFVAAHELRTPVTAIKGYLSMVLDGDAGPVSDSVKEFIVKVTNSNQRLIQLVNDLLQVARTEAGRLTVQVVPTDVVQPVKSVFDELRPLADEKSIELIYNPPGDLPKALADATRFTEILVNLVGNAIKYSPNKATVTVSHEVKDGTFITRVADTGFGMSAEAQKKLFEKFYRVQTEHTRNITGTGLGLFIVKQIVEKMGGKIWVESEEGKGSTFSFSLKLA